MPGEGPGQRYRYPLGAAALGEVVVHERDRRTAGLDGLVLLATT